MKRFAIFVAGAIALGSLGGIAASVSRQGRDTGAIELAEKLDKMVQPRFQESSEMFGVSRIPTNPNMHRRLAEIPQAHYRESSPFFKPMERAYVVGFFHCADKPVLNRLDHNKIADPKKLEKPYYESLVLATDKVYSHPAYRDKKDVTLKSWEEKNNGSIEAACNKEFSNLKKGKKAEQGLKDWMVVMRPIKLEKEMCLSCHKGAKKGDTLGVLVYAVSRYYQGKSAF